MVRGAGSPLTARSALELARGRGELAVWVLVVALGAALLVVTAVNQPYNQNEWVQLRPYDKPDLGEAIAGPTVRSGACSTPSWQPGS